MFLFPDAILGEGDTKPGYGRRAMPKLGILWFDLCNNTKNVTGRVFERES
jgi:hypothetical protein